MKQSTLLNVLVLCEGNSCRSQMAHGWLRDLSHGRVVAYSAGSNPTGSVHRLAVRVMAEAGVDISAHISRHMNDYQSQRFAYVITVCQPAAEACPTYPGPARRMHWPFDNPATVRGSEDFVLSEFRRVRDEIRASVVRFLMEEASLPGQR